MKFDQLLECIRCVECGGAVSAGNKKIECTVCDNSMLCVDEKVYCILPPENVEKNTKSSTYALWSNWRKANYHFFKDHLASQDSSKRVLDLGCGPAQFRELFSKFETYVGVDFYPYDLVSVVTDLTKPLPFVNEIFDVIILSNTLEHMPSVPDILAECYRVLAPGGVILITIPFLMRIHQAPYDFNRYTHFQLERLLKEASFNDVSVESLGKPLDVYEKIQHQFFMYLIDTKVSNNRSVQALFRMVSRVIWWCVRGGMLLLKPLYGKAEKTKDYTEGYGARAIKH